MDVAITPPLDEIKPFIRPSSSVDDIAGEVMGLVIGGAIGLGIGLVAVVLAATIFVVVWRRRRNVPQRTPNVEPG